MIQPNCPFELTGGKWICPQCDWIYPLEAKPDPPHRNCLRGPKGIDRLFAVVVRRFADMTIDWPPIEVKIRTCYDCERFNGRTCTERGSECKHFERWIERLLFGRCEAWIERLRIGTCKLCPQKQTQEQ